MSFAAIGSAIGTAAGAITSGLGAAGTATLGAAKAAPGIIAAGAKATPGLISKSMPQLAQGLGVADQLKSFIPQPEPTGIQNIDYNVGQRNTRLQQLLRDQLGR